MIISNSEVEALGTCERLHYYKFALGLQAKKESQPIQIGVAGHKVLEAYYRAGIGNTDYRGMYLAAIEALANMADKAMDENDLDILNLIRQRFHAYIKVYNNDTDWRIVDVEGRYNMPLDDNIEYGLTLDLLVEVIAGPYRGQFIVVDHKFCANFQTVAELSMNPQIPKYIATLKHLGFNISRGILNQIRYRQDIKDIDKLFRRSWLKPLPVRLEGVMREQHKASLQVHDRITMPVAEYRENVRRHMSKRNCGGCAFILPCSLELDGRDVEASRVLALGYKENTYGYRGA